MSIGDPNKPMLMLIKPARNTHSGVRRFNRHHKKPWEFDVGPHHLDRMQEMVDGDRPGMSPRSVLSDPEMLNMVKPAINSGFEVATDRLNDRWLFMEIVPSPDNERRHFGGTVNNRVLRLGYLTEEPISRRAQGKAIITATDLNPTCDMVCTKQIDLNLSISTSAQGGRKGNFQCTQDADTVVKDDDLGLFDGVKSHGGRLGSENIFALDNTNLVNSLVDIETSQGDLYSGSLIQSDDSQSLRRKLSHTVSASENAPKSKARLLLQSLKQGTDDALFNGSHGDSAAADHYSAQSHSGYNKAIIDVMRANNRSRSRQSSRDIMGSIRNQADRMGMTMPSRVETRDSLQFHARNLGIDLQIVLLDATSKIDQKPGRRRSRELGHDVVDQNYISETNIYSSIVAATIPAYMVECGLSAIRFRYDSVLDGEANDIIRGNRFHDAGKRGSRECYQIDEAKLFMADAGVLDQRSAGKRFMDLIRLDLAPILKEAARGGVHTPGHFSMYVSSQINDNTDIKLVFLDGDGRARTGEHTVYRDHTSLGGIVSPHIGTFTNLHNNASGLFNAVNHMGSCVDAEIEHERMRDDLEVGGGEFDDDMRKLLQGGAGPDPRPAPDGNRFEGGGRRPRRRSALWDK